MKRYLLARQTDEPRNATVALTTEQLRLPATLLLLGGLLLVILAQAAVRVTPANIKLGLYLLSAVGVAAFLAGGQLVIGRAVPAVLVSPVQRLAGCLTIKPAQLLMLLMALCFTLLAWMAAGRGLGAWQAPVSVTAWLVAIALVVAGSLEWPVPRILISRRVLWLSVGLLVVALLLRGLATAQIPDTFSGDEGAAGLFSAMFLTGETNNLLSLGWYAFPSLYFGLQSLGILIWGQTVEALRLSSALAGALTVVAVYWLGRVLFNRLTGLLAAIYMAGSHYHIHMSRIGLNNVWDGLFGTAVLIGLVDGWKHNRRLSFVLCGLALGLGLYFYVAIRALPVLLLVWAGAAFAFRRETFRSRLPGLLIAAYVALIVFLPLGLLWAQYPDEFNAPLARVSILGEDPGPNGMGAVILDQIVKAAAGFTSEPLRLLYDPGVPLLLPVAAALFSLGLLWALLHFNLRYLLMILPLLAVIVSSMLSKSAPASQRYIMVMPIVAVFVALPVALLVEWLQTLWPRVRRHVLVAGVLLVVLLALVDARYYFVEAYERYVLGGPNTEVATEIAYYLRDHEIQGQQVYFFGFPRMGYNSLPTIPYLAPSMTGEDIGEPPQDPPDWPLDGPTLFIFLPERISEVGQVKRNYPGGTYREHLTPNGDLHFAVYSVNQ